MYMARLHFFPSGNDHTIVHITHTHTHTHTHTGLPPGVVNIVYGVGPKAGEAIVKHPDIPVISFTGSTLIGQRIQTVSAPYIKKLSLEVFLL